MDLFIIIAMLEKHNIPNGNTYSFPKIDAAAFINEIIEYDKTDILELDEVKDLNDEKNAEIEALENKIEKLEAEIEKLEVS